MLTIKTYPMPNSSVLRIYSDKEFIKIDPQYQRKGDVWTLEKKQLLVDSILNEYDIPKLYFHFFTKTQRDQEESYEYAIIDGRQRIQTIFEFIDGVFPLDSEFDYLADSSINAGGMTYTDLAKNYPKLKIRFDSFTLPIVLVETDDLDLIEDMFSRLNEAVPLNSAEKRNAYGGTMAETIRKTANHPFFVKKVKFKNNRLQHYEVAARVLFLEYSLFTSLKILDTKKPYLDKMVVDNASESNVSSQVYASVMNNLDNMISIFGDNDQLLRNQSPVTIYYLLFREASNQSLLSMINRPSLVSFYEILELNRKTAETDITRANYDYLEFDRMSQQGTNDASSIRERTRIIGQYFNINIHLP